MYDLTRLGHARFEHLVQALALAHLGSGVDVFGSGPDGGREATFRGEVNMEGKGKWDGYGVIQAKYKERLTTTAADQTWFFETITTELKAWIDPRKKRHKNQPDYLVIVTNVPLTAVEHKGGLDRLEQLFTRYRDIGGNLSEGTTAKTGMSNFRDYAIWHAEYLDRLLENNREVRRSYADLVLPGDVIARLYEQIEADDRRIADAWIGHIARAVKVDTSIELGESGDKSNTPLSLAEVAVDLPAAFAPLKKSPAVLNWRTKDDRLALQTLVERSDQVLTPSLRPAARDRVVILGGPGSGKSTLSRLLCQIHRVALIQQIASGRVTEQVATRAEEIRKAFDAANLPTPTLHRLPVRVVLSNYADAVSSSPDLTLLQYIVQVINHRGSDPIDVAQAKRMSAAWPLLIILDGMDEVASARNRREVSARISDFLTEMAALSADVFTVCTSRPMGFERDADLDYEELYLEPLQPKHAMAYASRLLSHRFAEAPDRKDQTLERLEKSSRNPETARLMTSPLQVTILSLILEQRRQAPASRYTLFKSYYDTIYARECNKPEGIGDVLETYRAQFDQLHEKCGLAIHAQAERAGAAQSVLPIDELELIARGILESEGHREADIDELIRQILHLAQQRLVLLVPKMDGVAFEVRSLAEFFAARSLMAGEDAADKLELLVPSAHWRHTWLLAAGYIFSERLSLRDAVLSRLSAADHSNAVNRLVMPGALLAIDALEDGFAASTPRFERDLLIAALRLLAGPSGSHITWLSKRVAPFMARSEHLNEAVWRETEALMADQTAFTTRKFLSGLAESDYRAISVLAQHRVNDYFSKPRTSPDYWHVSETKVFRRIWKELAEAGLIEGKGSDYSYITEVAGMSTDGSEEDRLVLAAREIIVAGCRESYSARSTIRERLAAAIARDHVGHVLHDQERPHTTGRP